METPEQYNGKIGHRIMLKYWPLALIFFFVFIPVSFFIEKDYLSGWCLSIAFLIFSFLVVYYYITRNVIVSSNLFVSLGLPVLLPWLITGGPAGNGFWWVVAYAIFVFFLTKMTHAFFWLSTLVVLSFIIICLSHFGIVKIAYSYGELLNISFSFIIAVVLIYYFKDENERHLNKSIEELTERRKAEEKYKQLATIIDYSNDSIISKKLDGSILTWNKGAENILGYTYEEVKDNHLPFIHDNKLIEEENSFIKKVSNGEHIEQYETIRIRKDGTIISVSITLSPILDANGNITAVSEVLRDITKSKEHEEKLMLLSILEAKSKEMEQFTYIASHDLRQPLLTILNYIKIFDEDYKDKLDDEAKYCLSAISGAANRMDRLIIGLLDYSRLSKIKELEIVNCNEIYQSVISDLNQSITTNNAIIKCSELPVIKAYPLELRQLFQNLISNGIKFRKKDTTPEININCIKTKGGYRFEFKDNGIGIKEKDIEKLFLIFQRLHSEKEYEGTGLGLAYCKKIVELHGGIIWIESQPGVGSSFNFTLNT